MRLTRLAVAAAALAAAIPALAAPSAFADPALAVTTPAFPDTPAQMMSGAQVVTVTNQSAYRLDVYPSGTTVTGAASDDYFLTATCTANLMPGDSCTIRLRFSPSATGARLADLSVGGTLYDGSGLMGISAVNTTVPLTGNGTALPAGTQGPAGPAGASGSTGATGTAGATGVAGADGTNGTNGANGAGGKDGARGRSGAAKLGSRAACTVTRAGRGSRVACTFKSRIAKRALVTLHDRRGRLAAARGNGTRRMVFVTARPARGALSVWAVVGPDVVHPVDRH